MKLLNKVIAQVAVFQSFVSGSSLSGQVFLDGVSQGTSPFSAIDLSTARSIFAQILGLSQFYTLNPSDDRVIELLDGLASSPIEVFGEPQKSSGRALIVLEGLSSSEGRWTTLLTIK